MFRHIETIHIGPDGKPKFGNLLDAGTGNHSLKWMCSLEKQDCLTSWSAVTADAGMLNAVRSELTKVHPSSTGRLVLGNWASSSDLMAAPPETHMAHNTGDLLPGTTYDTILGEKGLNPAR